MTSNEIMDFYVRKEGCYDHILAACEVSVYFIGSFLSFARQPLSSECCAGGGQRWRNLPILDVFFERGGVALHQRDTDEGL
jgi:hypothetical protein